MRYTVKRDGMVVAMAWSSKAAWRKALDLSMAQAELPVDERKVIEIWQGETLVGELPDIQLDFLDDE